ncbi:PP2C family protein-serine/threonine phosphatase [Prescottella equi]
MVWIALSALPWLTLVWHRRRTGVHVPEEADDSESTHQLDWLSDFNKPVPGPEAFVSVKRTPDDQRRTPLKSTAHPGLDYVPDVDETTVDFTYPAATNVPIKNFHDTHPLIRLCGADRRSERQLSPTHASFNRDRGEFVFTAASRTHEGMRPTNQDYALITPIVLGVADGAGGRPDGAAASQTALESVVRSMTDNPDVSLAEVVVTSNNDVRKLVGRRSGTAAATTLDLVYLDEFGDLTGAHVGDSRVGVLARDSMKVEWLTTDHATGNSLTRSIGPDPTVRPDIWVHTVEPGDLVIVATDGLWNRPQGQTLAERTIVARRDQDPDLIADALVSGAVGAGVRDNVTVVVGRVSVE